MTELLVQWILGLVTLSIVGIISMHVRISVMLQRLLDHMEHCDERHEQHRRNFEEVKKAIEAIR